MWDFFRIPSFWSCMRDRVKIRIGFTDLPAMPEKGINSRNEERKRLQNSMAEDESEFYANLPVWDKIITKSCFLTSSSFTAGLGSDYHIQSMHHLTLSKTFNDENCANLLQGAKVTVHSKFTNYVILICIREHKMDAHMRGVGTQGGWNFIYIKDINLALTPDWVLSILQDPVPVVLNFRVNAWTI